MDKLPSKNFSINEFKPLASPLQTVNLGWNNLPDSTVNVNAIPSRPFHLQQSVLPKPVMVKAGMPKLVTNTTSGVLQFSTEEGLPGFTISASIKDKYGNAWIATEKGLCRYSGDYLYIYTFLNKNEIGSYYTISDMTTDKEGNIWIVTAGDGIYIIDLARNLLLHDKSSLSCLDVLCDHTGAIWIATGNEGVLVIDNKRKSVCNINNAERKKVENTVFVLAEDRHSNVWLAYLDHVAVIDSARMQMKKITKREGLGENIILSFCEDWRGDMWIAAYKERVRVVSLKDNTVGVFNKSNGFDVIGAKLVEDSQQRLWLLRKDTSYILNKKHNAIKKIMIDAEMINQNTAGSAFADNQGNIWMGTINRGVIILDSKGALPETVDSKNGLEDNNVWGFVEDKKGLIWMTTRKGVNIYDVNHNQLKLFGAAQGLGSEISQRIDHGINGDIFITTIKGFAMVNPDKKIVVSYDIKQDHNFFFITKTLADNEDKVWLATQTGLFIYDLNKKTIRIIDSKAGLLSNTTWDLIKDKNGDIWAGSDSGITIINTRNNTLRYIRQKDGLCSNVIYKLIERPNGEIWAGTIKGISIIDPVKATITNLGRNEGLVPDEVYDMVQQKDAVYVGGSNGMFVVNLPDASSVNKPWNIVNYGKREGFPYNDFNQNTGIAASNGLIWWGITPVLTAVTQLPVKDSVQPEINITGLSIMDKPASFTSYELLNKSINETDTIWNEEKTKYFLKNKFPTDSGYLQSNNIKWDSISSGFGIPVGLVLPYHQNSVSFSFSNTNITGRERILYRYILEGVETKWNDVSDKATTKNYFNLAPGEYTFRVRTLGSNGVWSKEATCSFTITPPWWKTWWAYILYVVAAVVVATAYANYRSYQLRKENAALETKVNQRTGELSKSIEDLKATQAQLIQSEKMASLGELTAGIAHEIQNPLNFVNNFSEVSNELIDELKAERQKPISERDETIEEDILDDIKLNLEKINHHGKRADAIVKGMLQHSRSSSGQKELTDINALCDEYLRLSYHGLRAKDKSFNADFKTDFDTTIGKINIVPQDIGRVLLNLFNNAFYAVNERSKLQAAGYKPLVKLSTRKIADKIEISVEDNGNGIPQNIVDKIFQPFFTTKPTGQGTGLGLSLSYDIVTKGHEGSLSVISTAKEEGKDNAGTVFIVTLPVKQYI